MSDIDLSFLQLRQDIFEGILSAIGDKGYTGIHNALVYGRDPEQLIIPKPEDTMLLSQYGVMSLRYPIPNNHDIYINVALTLGRLNYNIQAHKDLVDAIDLKDGVMALAAEIGIKCGIREIHDEVRFELCNDPTLVWAPTAINILRSPQLEQAFTEFVRLQANKIIVSLSGILASKGIVKPAQKGVYALLMVRSMGRSDILESIVSEHFSVVTKDAREPLNVVYAIRSNEDSEKPLVLFESLTKQLVESGYNVTIRPAWGFSEMSEMIMPLVTERIVEVERLVDKIVEVEKLVEVEKIIEVEKIVEVEIKPPVLDMRSLLREPRIDD